MSIGIVTTKYGQVSGQELAGPYAGITTFRSVSYAQPPVGDLRFKPPGARTWSYVFGRYLPCLAEERGTFRDTDNLLAWHSGELWYTFASLRQGVPACRPWEKADFDLAADICSYWANFIATGDPNGTDLEGRTLPAWPESRENYGWMLFTDAPHGQDGLDAVDRIALADLERSGEFPAI